MLLFFVLVFFCLFAYTCCAFMVSHLPRKPIFTASQLDRLSNIFDNAGQGFFVVLVLTPLVEGIDKVNSGMLLLGAIDVLGCWIISLTLARIKDKRKRL